MFGLMNGAGLIRECLVLLRFIAAIVTLPVVLPGALPVGCDNIPILDSQIEIAEATRRGSPANDDTWTSPNCMVICTGRSSSVSGF